MNLAKVKQVAREAAARHDVEFVGISPDPRSDGYEVRMRHHNIDWQSVMVLRADMSLGQFRAEVFDLAESCAEGPRPKVAPEFDLDAEESTCLDCGAPHPHHCSRSFEEDE